MIYFTEKLRNEIKGYFLYSFSTAFWGMFIYGPVVMLLSLLLPESVAILFVTTFIVSFAAMYIIREIKNLDK